VLTVIVITNNPTVSHNCFLLITSTSNDINKNDFVNHLNNRMCGPVKVNRVCSENHSSSKGPVTKAAVNKTSVEQERLL
jgi:hypothetical protein